MARVDVFFYTWYYAHQRRHKGDILPGVNILNCVICKAWCKLLHHIQTNCLNTDIYIYTHTLTNRQGMIQTMTGVAQICRYHEKRFLFECKTNAQHHFLKH